MKSEMVIAVLGVICTMLSIFIAFISYKNTKEKEKRNETVAEAKGEAFVNFKLDYISKGVDDIRLEQKQQGTDIKELTARIIKVEESSKQAHKRIDEIATTRGERENE